MAIETDDCNIAEFLVPRPIVQSVIASRPPQTACGAGRTNIKQTAPPASTQDPTASTRTHGSCGKQTELVPAHAVEWERPNLERLCK